MSNNEEWLEIGKISTFIEREMVPVSFSEKELVVIKYKNCYFCYEDNCTHENKKLSNGWVENEKIVCKAHRGQFDLKTGDSCSPPASGRLKTFPTKIVENRLFVKLT